MKTLDINEMQSLQGSGWFDGFCDGVTVSGAILGVGSTLAVTEGAAALSFLAVANPVGMSAAIGFGVIVGGSALACAVFN